MKLRTVRVRRSRPSVLALALSLMITMFFVYISSLPAPMRRATDASSESMPGSAEIRMEGLESAFVCAGRYESELEARLRAALCADTGGAGLILADGSEYAVISQAVSPEKAPADALMRTAGGLTLKISGPAGEIAAVSDAVNFLRAQAVETGGLAAALESGDTDMPSVCTLLSVYRTQGQRALSALHQIQSPGTEAARLFSALEAALDRIESALAEPDAGKIKLIHAAACAQWISILEDFTAAASE